MLEKGAKIELTDSVIGNSGKTILRPGSRGTIERVNGRGVWVKMDNHPGFSNQGGCWIVDKSDLQVIDLSSMNNKQLTHLLESQY